MRAREGGLRQRTRMVQRVTLSCVDANILSQCVEREVTQLTPARLLIFCRSCCDRQPAVILCLILLMSRLMILRLMILNLRLKISHRRRKKASCLPSWEQAAGIAETSPP